MTGHSSKYERLGDRAERGAYELVEPLDYLILAELPDEGELVMGYYPLAVTVPQLAQKFKPLPSLKIGARLTSLKVQGLCVGVKMGQASGHKGWQRTTQGKKLYEQWKEGQKK